MNQKRVHYESRFVDNISEPSDDSRVITGYAAIFDSPTKLNQGWVETIKKGSITQKMIDESDVFAKLNHADDKILARRKNGKGSLSLEVDERGLKYSFSAPKTALGDELLEYVRRGEITSSSFGFFVASDGEDWYKRNGEVYRDINNICLVTDVSPVFSPAYTDTVCALKRYEDFKARAEEINCKFEALLRELEDK